MRIYTDKQNIIVSFLLLSQWFWMILYVLPSRSSGASLHPWWETCPSWGSTSPSWVWPRQTRPKRKRSCAKSVASWSSSPWISCQSRTSCPRSEPKRPWFRLRSGHKGDACTLSDLHIWACFLDGLQWNIWVRSRMCHTGISRASRSRVTLRPDSDYGKHWLRRVIWVKWSQTIWRTTLMASWLRRGETGVKGNGSSVVECELMPFSGSYQPDISKSFKKCVISSEKKPPRDTALLSKASTIRLENRNEDIIGSSSLSVIRHRLKITGNREPWNSSAEGVRDCSGMHSLLKWNLRAFRVSSSQFPGPSFILQTSRTVLTAM